MPATIILWHDRHFDLVADEEGEFEVQTSEGPQRRRRDEVALEGGYTELSFPDDYDANPTALLHLIQAVTSRHAAEADIYAVSGDEPNLVNKLATLLNAEVRTTSEA